MAKEFKFYPSRKIQLNDISISNGVITIDCPTRGLRFKRFGFELGDSGAGNGNAPAMSTISEASFQLGNSIVRRLSGAKLDAINSLNGSQYGARDSVTGGANGTGRKQFNVYCEEPWRKRGDYGNGLAWQTGWLGAKDVLQAKIKVPTLTTPVISAWAIVDDFNEGQPNNIVKMIEESANVSSASFKSTKLFDGLPATDLISQVSFFNTTPNARTITQASMKINGEDVFDAITYQQNFTDLLGSDMNPAAGAFHFVFDQDDLFESMRMVREIRSSKVDLTLSAAETGSIEWLIQRLGLPTE